MSGQIIEIPQTKGKASIWDQRLKVAASCRISTDHEDQKQSLENQVAFYTNYVRRNPYWKLVSVYTDRSSGLHTKNRPGYQQLLKDCRRKKIDLILVKSLSRFGRDAQETIRTIRRLKAMGIGVYAEQRGLNTLTTLDSIIDMYAAFDQAESRERSDNIKFGIRQRMRSGKVLLNHSQFLGYTKDTDGVLRVVPEEAEIVRKIFALYLQGNGVRKIKRYLEEHGIKTVTRKSKWSTSTIDRMLSNEKYIGRLLMQKTYTPDFLTGKQIRNQEDLDMYFIENAHEAIIDKESFEKVQARKKHAAK